MWKIKYEWLKPGVRERDIEAKVHEFMLERGCEIIYDINRRPGGNTSPYRRWATDKLIRQGDLVIVDINAVGPSGYFIDFVRCFKCGGPYGTKMTRKEIGLYSGGVRLDVRRPREPAPGKTTADVARAFPKYDDDKYRDGHAAAVCAQHRITLYEGMWIPGRTRLKYPRKSRKTCTSHSRTSRVIRARGRHAPGGELLVTAKGPGRLHAHGTHEEAMAGKTHAVSPRSVSDRSSQPFDPAREVLSSIGAELRMARHHARGHRASLGNADALLVTSRRSRPR